MNIKIKHEEDKCTKHTVEEQSEDCNVEVTYSKTTRLPISAYCICDICGKVLNIELKKIALPLDWDKHNIDIWD